METGKATSIADSSLTPAKQTRYVYERCGLFRTKVRLVQWVQTESLKWERHEIGIFKNAQSAQLFVRLID